MDRTRTVIISTNVATTAALAVIVVASITTGPIWWIWVGMAAVLAVTVGVNIAYFRTR